LRVDTGGAGDGEKVILWIGDVRDHKVVKRVHELIDYMRREKFLQLRLPLFE